MLNLSLASRSSRLFQNISYGRFHTYIKAPSQGNVIRIPLGSPKVIGIAESRGNRNRQEDSHQFAALSLDPEELRHNAKKSFGIDWDPSSVGDAFARQVLFVGIYDGHGGQAVSLYLHQNLHGLFESAHKSHIPDLYAWTRELGGYFKRFRGGVLAPWLEKYADQIGTSTSSSTEAHDAGPELDLEARATMAFLEADRIVCEGDEALACGAAVSVALIQTFDSPPTPFYAAQKVGLTVAHCGDTRVILAPTDGGRPYRMTQDHHADARGEASRLRRLGSSRLILDSFGESRYMGALQNTRGIGDKKFKPFGVTAEPEVKSKLLNGSDWAYIVMCTDGISSVLSDAEIVDLARNASCPKGAAKAILDFAQEMGSEDNATVLIIPLAGWGQIRGPDRTKEYREYRRNEAIGSERRRRM